MTNRPTGSGFLQESRIGTGAGSVAAGDDARIVGAAQKANNGSDFSDAGSTRANLHVGLLAACQAVATSNLTLSATQTVDGVALAVGDQVLATAQSTASQNGPWVVAAGAWTRPTDYATGLAVKGRIVLVNGGTVYAGTIWKLTTSVSVTVGTTSTTWGLANSAYNDNRYGPTIGPATGDATGVADQAMLQAALTAQTYVKGLPGQTYFINTPLTAKQGGNQTIDMTGCTIKLVNGSTCTMLQNYARSGARFAGYIATTSGSAVINNGSGTDGGAANFVSGDVGAQLWVWGAGPNGSTLKTTILSVQSGTQATMATTASVALAATQCSIGTRDTYLRVIGGIWDRQANGGSGGNRDIDGCSMVFRRADRLLVKPEQVRGGGATTVQAINIADAEDFEVSDVFGQTASSIFQCQGPVRQGVIRNIFGFTGDDTVAVVPHEVALLDDTWGNCEFLDISDIHPWSTASTAVVVIAGQDGGNNACDVKHVTISNVDGYATNADETVGGIVWLGNNGTTGFLAGGHLSDIRVDGVSGFTTPGSDNTQTLVYLANGFHYDVHISHLNLDNPSVVQHGVSCQGNTFVESLHISDTFVRQAVSGSQVLQLGGSTQIKCLFMDHISGNLTNSLVNLNASSVQVVKAVIEDCYLRSGGGPVAMVSGATLTYLMLNRILEDSVTYTVGQLFGTTEVHLTDIQGGGTSALGLIGTAGIVTVYASNCNLAGKSFTINSGGKLESKSIGFPIDVSTLNQKNEGDMAYNINAALSCGVGPVGYSAAGTGNGWKQLITAATY